MLAILSLIPGCGTPEHWRFDEEIMLSTGEKIVISRDTWRFNQWFRTSSEGGAGSVINQSYFYFPIDINWDEKRSGEIVSIDRVTGDLYIASLGYGYGKYASERPLYCDKHPHFLNMTFWKHVGTHWEIVPQTDLLAKSMKFNVLPVSNWELKPTFLHLQDKTSLYKSYTGPYNDFTKPESLADFASHAPDYWSCEELLRAQNRL